MFAKLKGAKLFSTIDLRSSYYHIGLTHELRAKSAFVVPMGKWEFKRTPFGLSPVPVYFQFLIDKVLMGCSRFVMGYLDDIIIFSNNESDQLQHIETTFNRLEHFSLKMKKEKCDFFKKHIQYLGHLIAEEGYTPLSEKLESIRNMPRPKTLKEGKTVLRLDKLLQKKSYQDSQIWWDLSQILQDMIQNLSGQKNVTRPSRI